jgi:hypothetical protein
MRTSSIDKRKDMRDLLDSLKMDQKSSQIKAKRGEELTDVGLVNQFEKHEFIPNKWFDWINRADSKIMIIGQDWGPYSQLKKFIDQYELEKDSSSFYYDEFLFRSFSSRTEVFIFKAVEETYREEYGSDTTKIDLDNNLVEDVEVCKS